MRPCALHVRPASRLPHCRRLPGFPLAISVSSVCRPLSIHAATLAHGHGSEAAWQDVCCIWMLFGCGLENQYLFYFIFFCKRTSTHTLLFRHFWKAVLWNILALFCKVWSGSSWKTMDVSSQDSTLILVQSFSSGPWYSGTDLPSPCGAAAYLYTDTLDRSIVIKSWILCILLLWRWTLLYYCRTHLCGHLHSRWLRN